MVQWFIAGVFVCAGDLFIEQFAVEGNLEFVKVCDFVSADEHIVGFFDLDVTGQLLLKLVSYVHAVRTCICMHEIENVHACMCNA